jgi:hypothetical protein
MRQLEAELAVLPELQLVMRLVAVMAQLLVGPWVAL